MAKGTFLNAMIAAARGLSRVSGTGGTGWPYRDCPTRT